MRRLALIAPVLAVLAIAAVGGAATLSAPTASTGPVSTVTNSTAGVSGSVNPGGESTTWYVEYGTTTGYGKKTSSANAGSGTSTVPVSVTLASLAAGTTYHYRVVATNASGTARGGDGILTTTAPSAPPTVVTGGADQIGPFKAALHGTVDPNGLQTSWYFEYGKTTGYGTKTPTENAGSGTSALNVSMLVQNLEAGVTYHFRLVGSSSAGTTRGADRTFTTDAAPSVMTGPAQSVTATTAVVTGTINPRGRASTVWFEYGTSTAYGSKTAPQSAGFETTDKAVSATLTGLKIGTSYHYRIVGQSDAGTVRGADASFRTSSAPTVTTGVASLVDASSAVMNGTVNPNGHTTTWYFEYGTSTSYGARTENHNVGNGTVAVSVADTARKLNAATTYHFRLVAFSSRGTTRGADATFKTLGPPTARTGPVTQISTSSATVSGRVNTFGLAGTYWIEYGHTASYGLRTNPANLTPTSSDVGVSVGLSGLEPGRRYHFRVVVSTTGGTTASNDSSFGTAALPRSPSGRIVHCTITGTTGPDTLRGTPGPDVICGLGGADLIFGLGGNDVIYAGPGNDIVIAGAGNDVVYGGPGDDRIEGGRGRDFLVGGPGHDVLLGGPGRDTLIARDGVRDIINGGPGIDRGRIDLRRDARISVERLY